MDEDIAIDYGDNDDIIEDNIPPPIKLDDHHTLSSLLPSSTHESSLLSSSSSSVTTTVPATVTREGNGNKNSKNPPSSSSRPNTVSATLKSPSTNASTKSSSESKSHTVNSSTSSSSSARSTTVAPSKNNNGGGGHAGANTTNKNTVPSQSKNSNNPSSSSVQRPSSTANTKSSSSGTTSSTTTNPRPLSSSSSSSSTVTGEKFTTKNTNEKNTITTIYTSTNRTNSRRSRSRSRDRDHYRYRRSSSRDRYRRSRSRSRDRRRSSSRDRDRYHDDRDRRDRDRYHDDRDRRDRDRYHDDRDYRRSSNDDKQRTPTTDTMKKTNEKDLPRRDSTTGSGTNKLSSTNYPSTHHKSTVPSSSLSSSSAATMKYVPKSTTTLNITRPYHAKDEKTDPIHQIIHNESPITTVSGTIATSMSTSSIQTLPSSVSTESSAAVFDITDVFVPVHHHPSSLHHPSFPSSSSSSSISNTSSVSATSTVQLTNPTSISSTHKRSRSRSHSIDPTTKKKTKDKNDDDQSDSDNDEDGDDDDSDNQSASHRTKGSLLTPFEYERKKSYKFILGQIIKTTLKLYYQSSSVSVSTTRTNSVYPVYLTSSEEYKRVAQRLLEKLMKLYYKPVPNDETPSQSSSTIVQLSSHQEENCQQYIRKYLQTRARAKQEDDDDEGDDDADEMKDKDSPGNVLLPSISQRGAIVPLPSVTYQQAIVMRPKDSQNPRASTNVVLVSENNHQSKYTATAICSQLIANYDTGSFTNEDCMLEVQTNLRLHRGTASLHDPVYLEGVTRLERYLADNSYFSKEYGTQNIFYHPYKAQFLKNIFSSLTTLARPANFCEIGFNAGHTSLFFLATVPKGVVYAFDHGLARYTIAAHDYLDDTYPERVVFLLGDTVITIPQLRQYYPDSQCDIVYIDGSTSSYETTLKDIEKLSELISYDHIVILGNSHKDSPATQAWKEATNIGYIQWEGTVYESFNDVNGDALLYGSFTPGFKPPVTTVQVPAN